MSVTRTAFAPTEVEYMRAHVEDGPKAISKALNRGYTATRDHMRKLRLPLMVRPRFKWTKAALAELEALSEQGLSDKEIARRLGASEWSVRENRFKKNLPSRAVFWTAEKDATLRRLFANGYSDAELAKTLSTSERAIGRRRQHLELLRPNPIRRAALGPAHKEPPPINPRKDEQFVERLLCDGPMPVLREAALSTGRAAVLLRGKPVISAPVSILGWAA